MMWFHTGQHDKGNPTTASSVLKGLRGVVLLLLGEDGRTVKAFWNRDAWVGFREKHHRRSLDNRIKCLCKRRNKLERRNQETPES
jgi:hypothetical protein